MRRAMELITINAIIIFIFVLTWIIKTGIFNYNRVIWNFNHIVLLIGITLYIILICFIYKYLITKLERYKCIEYFLFVFFTVAMIIFGQCLKVNPSWDMGTCFEIAKEWVEKGTFTNTIYPSQFPNNIMMITIEILIFRLMKIIGVKDYLSAITTVVAIIISVSIIVTFYIVKRISNRKNALTFLTITLITTPLYLYSAEYYTDTFSMLTTVLLFYLWIMIKEDYPVIIHLLMNIIYGVVLFVAIKIKLTSAFVFISIFIYELIQGNCKILFKRMLIILPTTVLCIMVFNITIVNRFAPKELRIVNEIPKEHWIMMGMNGVGDFRYSEYEYTNAPENKNIFQKKKADRNKIIERLTTRSFEEHIEHIKGKLAFAWHDGTYWAPEVLRREIANKNKLHEFVLLSEENSKYYKYIPQIMHFSMLIFILINTIRILVEKRLNSKYLIPIITMFGVMIFLIIWENRSRYLVNILPLMMMSQIGGIEYLSNKIFPERNKKTEGTK